MSLAGHDIQCESKKYVISDPEQSYKLGQLFGVKVRVKNFINLEFKFKFGKKRRFFKIEFVALIVIFHCISSNRVKNYKATSNTFMQSLHCGS